ncbi:MULTISPECIES: pyridoxamine 5'-phosphate oxidase family protein [unclassified Streptomyces]|uniref:pyridoxamine 5'-phosphate oxidase family protein n=1 Tax=Streptomyces sp. NPDC127532 TaxID=3345399 RepID=UPI0036392801
MAVNDRPVPRTQPLRDRGLMHYGEIHVAEILDEAVACHVGYVRDGQPQVQPMTHVRVGDRLYLHGSTGSRMMLTAGRAGLDVCVVATLIDAYVLARSSFNHTVNYRCAVVHGRGVPVEDQDRKSQVFRALLDKIADGRSADCRSPAKRELAQTAMLSLPLTEASVRIQSGGVADEPEDLALPCWAGIVPLRTTAGPPAADVDERLVPLPGYLRDMVGGATHGA